MNYQRLLFAIVLISCSTFSHAAQTTRTLVDDHGLTKYAKTYGSNWQEKNSTIIGQGKNNYLLSTDEIGPGDFELKARISIDKIDSTAASILLGRENHFGLDSRSKTFFIEGPLFSRPPTMLKAKSADHIQPGKPFDVHITKRNNILTIKINNKQIHQQEINQDAIDTPGLRPWRSTMKIYALSITANFIRPLPPLPTTDLFHAKDGQYAYYRIPSIITTKKKTLLAFAEGRKNSRSDSGNIDIVMRRSTDNGKSWSKTSIVWDDGPNTCGNPCPVVDQATGNIYMLMTWNRGDDHEGKIKTNKSKDTRRVFVAHSKNDGITWTKPIEITSTTKKKNWGWYATGPGAGIQLVKGKHKGRLVIPCDHSIIPWTGSDTYRSHIIFSDDHGKSWQLGGTIKPAVNECEVVELSNGDLMINMRNYRRSGHTSRAIATSKDGGATWSKVTYDKTLIEPVCQASIRRYAWPTATQKGAILFTNPASFSGRTNMTLRLSEDDGKSWKYSKSIYRGSSAYSCITILGDGQIGIFYEADAYKRITFTKLPLTWLTNK